MTKEFSRFRHRFHNECDCGCSAEEQLIKLQADYDGLNKNYTAKQIALEEITARRAELVTKYENLRVSSCNRALEEAALICERERRRNLATWELAALIRAMKYETNNDKDGSKSLVFEGVVKERDVLKVKVKRLTKEVMELRDIIVSYGKALCGDLHFEIREKLDVEELEKKDD